ncbi:SURF1 family protein [Methylobacterium isbiliense]|nr:SURF1 family protein [Methylobacterium isbiliense]MDN3623502.1 SURF1 family protein [Methylobacterium isbiliense]
MAALVAFDLAAILIVLGLCGLAAWQMQRRTWKLDLIARVAARVHASPAPAPGPERWAAISAAADEYRRVAARGAWLGDRSTLVQAVTDLGGGYWVMTPLARDDGTTILVNRGFVPADRRAPDLWRPRAGPVAVTGLLRLTEPRGGFLRANDPAADRWFSRDVAAIAEARGLSEVAPYFIDVERGGGEGTLPVPGLTVIAFSNNHLVYAITWGVLALMAAVGTVFVNLDLLRPGREARARA